MAGPGDNSRSKSRGNGEADNFKLSPTQLRAAITKKTTTLLICSPSNPTGTMYSPEELGQLADVVLVLARQLQLRAGTPSSVASPWPLRPMFLLGIAWTTSR